MFRPRPAQALPAQEVIADELRVVGARQAKHVEKMFHAKASCTFLSILVRMHSSFSPTRGLACGALNESRGAC